ncbi:hypothetical protein H6P81_003184 [Aristolochia fimbriata]|uniref:Uncharacterized protein n=1 Tax=Aristolochia fimbriata TaxID=158543 RepID=A0AAV7FCZ1_ARIFI|nr:hypothetical protein H6P81_003184 [Aristolochia fimbriata]
MASKGRKDATMKKARTRSTHIFDEAAAATADDDQNIEENYAHLTGRQKRLLELRLKMNEARKANQTAMVVEKKKQEAPA